MTSPARGGRLGTWARGAVVACSLLAAPSSLGCAAETATHGAPVAPAPARVDGSTARAEAGRELDDFHAAAAASDEARYFGHFASDGVFLGTDAKERWDVPAFRAYAHPFFAKKKGWVFHPTRRAVTIAPDGATAWFDEDLLGERLGPARGSGVLVRVGGRYLIAQYNLALTVPNEKFDGVRSVIDGPPPADVHASYKKGYAAATDAATHGDLAGAQRLLETLVPAAKALPTEDLEFWLHNELTWIAWAQGDRAGALAEVDRAKLALDHGLLPDSRERSLRLHELWDRAYLLLEDALAAPPAERPRRLALARTARAAYAKLADAMNDSDGLAVLDAFFAVRLGDAQGAARAAAKVDLAKDDDVQDLYVLAAALDAGKDTAGAARARAGICGSKSYLMKPLILRALAADGHPCPP